MAYVDFPDWKSLNEARRAVLPMRLAEARAHGYTKLAAQIEAAIAQLDQEEEAARHPRPWWRRLLWWR